MLHVQRYFPHHVHVYAHLRTMHPHRFFVHFDHSLFPRKKSFLFIQSLSPIKTHIFPSNWCWFTLSFTRFCHTVFFDNHIIIKKRISIEGLEWIELRNPFERKKSTYESKTITWFDIFMLQINEIHRWHSSLRQKYLLLPHRLVEDVVKYSHHFDLNNLKVEDDWERHWSKMMEFCWLNPSLEQCQY